MQSVGVHNSALLQIRNSKIPVAVFLKNGAQMRGVIRGFDDYSVLLDIDGKCGLIYKHAISTIRPVRRVPLDIP